MIRFLKFTFSSAHFYHQTQWSADKNREVFGPCFDPYGHGHNYELEVGFFREHDNDDLEDLKGPLAEIVQLLDHHHLNYQVPEFRKKIPTTENIALYIGEQIQQKIPGSGLRRLRLKEMQDLWVEVDFE